MKLYRKLIRVIVVVLSLAGYGRFVSDAIDAQSTRFESKLAGHGLPSVLLREAPLIQMPGVEVPERSLLHEADSNNPLHWDGDTLFLFNNYGHPWRTSGRDLDHLGDRVKTKLGELNDKLQIWVESTFKDDDGTLYGAFHYEPTTICFSNLHPPTAPRIIWMRSRDNGASWEDLGFIISADPSAINCLTKSPWDSGGTGDFSFIADRSKEYFYFYGTSYDPRFEEQGIFVARMRFADRDNPSGKVMKWYRGAWSEPGLWGHVTPVFPAQRDYTRLDGCMFWGPSIHWNTYLNVYVMVMNHAADTKLTNDGIFITFNPDVSNPLGWSEPQIILDRPGILKAQAFGSAENGTLRVPPGVYYGELRAIPGGMVVADTISSGWYPQIIGTAKGQTDTLCGRKGRLFMTGMSRLEIVFLKPGEKAE